MAETRTDSRRGPEDPAAEASFGAEPTLHGPDTPSTGPSAGGRQAPIGSEQPGRYRLLRELARGGQGVVHVAWDEQLGREVAFKQLLAPRPPGQPIESLTPGEVRFVREARITAQLDHPGIAPVHEVGRRADGSLYSAQKLVRGRTLAAALEACKTLRERMALLQPLLGICQAVAFAHGRGVIHRDLKPGNVMLGDLGEAVVLDWGLGRTSDQPAPAGAADGPVESLLATDAGRTAQGALIGTPAYMSPEQAVGATGSVDARSDVWSLGVILYELLTGRRPFAGGSSEELLRAVATAPLSPVRERCPDAPQELAEVAQRALQRDPAQRYPSAKELAAELGAWLSGGRVVAHEYSSFELVRRFVVRNKALSSLLLALFSFTLIAAVVLYARNRAQEHQLAEGFLERSRAAAQQLRWNEAAIYGAAARLHEDTPGARWAAAQVGAIETTLLAHWRVWDNWLTDAIAPDGSWFVASSGRIRKVDVATGLLTSLPLEEAPLGCSLISPDGTALFCKNPAKATALMVGSADGKVRWRSGPGAFPTTAAFSPDGRLLALGRADGKLSLLDAATGAERFALAGHAAGLTSVAFAPDGRTFATAAGEVVVWDTATGARLWAFDPGADAAWFLPDGRLATSGRATAEIRAVGAAAPEWKARLWSTYRPAVPCRGNGYLAVAPGSATPNTGQDEEGVLWDLRLRRPIARFRGFTAGFSADCSRLLARTLSETRIWRLGAPAWRALEPPAGTAAGTPFDVLASLFTAQGRLAWLAEAQAVDCVAKGVCDPTIRGKLEVHLADVASGRELASAEALGALFLDDTSADGSLLAETWFDPALARRRVRVRSTEDLRPLATIDAPRAWFTPDPRLLATLSPEGNLRLWEARTGKLEREIATGVALNPWGSWLGLSADGTRAAIGFGNAVSLWDLAANAPLGRMRSSRTSSLVQFGFSPGGRLWTIDLEGQVSFLDADQRDQPFARASIDAVASGDGRLLALGAQDQPTFWDRHRIALWDLESGEHLLDVPQSVPGGLGISHDGRTLSVAVGAAGEPPFLLLALRPPETGLSPAAELARRLQLPGRTLEGTAIVEAAVPVPVPDLTTPLDAAVANPGFEEGEAGAPPPGWSPGRHPESAPPATSTERPFAGARCARIEALRPSPDRVSAELAQAVDARPFRGKTVRLRAALRAEVEGTARASLKLQEAVNRSRRVRGFAQDPTGSIEDLPATSREWQIFERRIWVGEGAQAIVFGAILVGAGKAWIDEVSLEVVE